MDAPDWQTTAFLRVHLGKAGFPFPWWGTMQTLRGCSGHLEPLWMIDPTTDGGLGDRKQQKLTASDLKRRRKANKINLINLVILHSPGNWEGFFPVSCQNYLWEKMDNGKESQWLLIGCQVQHPYLFKGLTHKKISFSILTDSIYLGFQSIKGQLVPKMFCEMILMCSMICIWEVVFLKLTDSKKSH